MPFSLMLYDRASSWSLQQLYYYSCTLGANTSCNPGIKPTLQELLKFECTDRRVVNIPVAISTKYFQFGIFLLDDEDGSRIKNMAHKLKDDAEWINTEILHEWLTGRGKQPVTWKTLVKVLKDIELFTLAGDIASKHLYEKWTTCLCVILWATCVVEHCAVECCAVCPCVECCAVSSCVECCTVD